MVEKRPTPFSHRPALSRSKAAFPLLSAALNAAAVRHPCSSHRMSPPAQYCVKDFRSSPGRRAVFECRRVADGMRIVAPGGNSITISMSHKIRCPPNFGLKLPNAVTAHQPNARFALSRCAYVMVLGPRLKEAAGHMLLVKLQREKPGIES
jgi:hypothetical protein